MDMLSFLLREPHKYVENDAKLRAELELAKLWIESLTETAKSLNISRGQLCRKVLPFTEDTDAQDQANLTTTSQCSLQEGAVRVRKFLRLKLSDENDLKQAADALALIESCLSNSEPNI